MERTWYIVIIGLILGLPGDILAQYGRHPLSAGPWMTTAPERMSSELSGYQANPAHLAGYRQHRFQMEGENRLGLPGVWALQVAAIRGGAREAMGVALEGWSAGQQPSAKLSLGYGRVLSDMVQVGVEFHGVWRNYGKGDRVLEYSGSLGLSVQDSGRWAVGMSLYRPDVLFMSAAPQRIREYGYRWGCRLRLSEKADLHLDAMVRGGLGWDLQGLLLFRVRPAFTMRYAFSWAGTSVHLGCQWHVRSMVFRLSATYHPVLGMSSSGAWQTGVPLVADK